MLVQTYCAECKGRLMVDLDMAVENILEDRDYDEPVAPYLCNVCIYLMTK